MMTDEKMRQCLLAAEAERAKYVKRLESIERLITDGTPALWYAEEVEQTSIELDVLDDVICTVRASLHLSSLRAQRSQS